MFKCQVLWKLFICFIISRWRSHFNDHWCHPVFLFTACIFSGTLAKNEKHFPSISYRIPYSTTVAKDPNDFFLLWIWQLKLFHLKQLQSKLLFDPQIHLFSCFILAIAFVSPQTHKYNTGLNSPLKNKGSKYAYCLNWVNIHIYKLASLFVGMIGRNQH